MSNHETTDATRPAPADNHAPAQALYRDSFPAPPQGDRSEPATKTADAGVKSAGPASEQKMADSPVAKGNDKTDNKLGLPSLEIVDSGAKAGAKTDAPASTGADKQQELIKNAQHTLGDASASATDKLATARTLADAGIHNIQVSDQSGKSQNYHIETEKAGPNTMVHMYGQDSHGKDQVALRGVQHADGSFSHEKDRHGHEVSYEGAHRATAHGGTEAAPHVAHKAAQGEGEKSAVPHVAHKPASAEAGENKAADKAPDKAADKKTPEELDGTVTSTHTAKGTGYYPFDNKLQGGHYDMKGEKLHTLQDYLAGKAPYVSVAMDNKAGIPYGQKVNIPEMNDKYGQNIPFKVVDTGSAFHGKGTSRIDICTKSMAHAQDNDLNGRLTLQFVK